MLVALKRWRKYQGLPAFPTPTDNTPVFPLHRGKGPLDNTTHVRNIVQGCYDRAVESLAEQGLKEEAEVMMDATAPALSPTVTWMFSAKKGTNQPKGRKYAQNKSGGDNVSVFM